MPSQVDTEQALALYEDDKLMSRQLVKGVKPLKKLNPRHRQLIALCLQGYSGNEMAVILDYTVSRVSFIRNDPLVVEAIEKFLADADQQLAQLLPKAVNVLSKAMDSADLNHALKASDQLFKTQGKFKEMGEKKQTTTAEDVARQIIRVKGEVEIITETATRITTSSHSGQEIDHGSNSTSGNN